MCVCLVHSRIMSLQVSVVHAVTLSRSLSLSLYTHTHTHTHTHIKGEAANEGAAPRDLAHEQHQLAGARPLGYPVTGLRSPKSLEEEVLHMSNTGWQTSSIDIQFLRSANQSLSHVHIHLLLLLLLSAFSWPGASDPAPYSSRPYPPTPVTLSPVPPHYTPYSSHPIPYTRQLTPVILYRTRVQCRTSYTVDPKPQALDPTPLALKPYYCCAALTADFTGLSRSSCVRPRPFSTSPSISPTCPPPIHRSYPFHLPLSLPPSGTYPRSVAFTHCCASNASRSAHRVCDSSPILCRSGAGNSPVFLV